jgi:hypothetical protein
VILNHRWQRETKDQELITKQSNELRRTRREIFVRYFTTESSLVLVGTEVKSRRQGGDLDATASDPPELQEAIAAYYPTLYDANLVAGTDVAHALTERNDYIVAAFRDSRGVEPSPDDLLTKQNQTYYYRPCERFKTRIIPAHH